MLNLILMVIIFCLLIISFTTNESFYGYKAPYFRSQAYQNVCEPDYGGLLRVKKTLQDNCLRTLEGPADSHMECYYDEFMRKNCYFI